MEMDKFYRVETRTDEEFLAGPHISEPIDDAELVCPRCGGQGEVFNWEQQEWQECELCVYPGYGRIRYDSDNLEHTEAYQRDGVSCFRTPEEVIEYFQWQDICPLTQAEVVLFEGEAVDIGLDDEPLAIPEKILRRWSWAEFEKEFCE